MPILCLYIICERYIYVFCGTFDRKGITALTPQALLETYACLLVKGLEAPLKTLRHMKGGEDSERSWGSLRSQPVLQDSDDSVYMKFTTRLFQLGCLL